MLCCRPEEEGAATATATAEEGGVVWSDWWLVDENVL